MAQTHFLKNLPRREVLERLAPRYKDLDVPSMSVYMALLGVADSILCRTDEQLEPFGVSQGKLRVLAELHLEKKRRMTPSQIAERLGVSKATITGLLDGLERCGLIARQRSDQDRRSQAVALSPSGLRLVEKALAERFRRVAKLMSKLDRAEKDQLLRLLDKIALSLART